MTGFSRTLGLVFALAALHAPVWALAPDDLHDAFDQGVEMLKRGHNDEALKAFQKVLAMSPSQPAAYELWKEYPYVPVWRDLLTAGGDFEQVARRLIALARLEKKARSNDAEAIKKLVATATGEGPALDQMQAVHALSADHGEYAVPYLLPLMVNGQADENRRDRAMVTLNRMSTDVVPPLLSALSSDDAVLRRNVAMVLGNIGDARAAASLVWLAGNDPDGSVQAAAKDSAQRVKASGDALANFLRMGDAYHHRRDSVLRDQDYSDVVWDWKGEKLVSMPVPRFLYNDEMAKTAYFNALRASPSSTDALAGLARAYIDEEVKVSQMEKAGKDISEWKAKVDESRLAVHAAGIEALNLALQWSVKSGDSSTAAELCRVLGPLCKTPVSGLQAALASDDGAIRSEAAVAIGQISLRSEGAASPAVIGLLGESAGREVVRLAFVIDADTGRSKGLAAALEMSGVFASTWDSGAKGLAMLRQAPGLDVVLVADKLPDIPTAQVLDEIRADDRIANVPVLVITKDAEGTAGIYGDKIAGTLSGAEDMKAVQTALEKGVGGDRALADDLARRAAEVLAQMARNGRGDLSGVLGPLQSTLASRPDAVTIPAMQVLGAVGGPAQAGSLVAVLSDDKRSEECRSASGNALAGILSRNPGALGAEGLGQLQGVVGSNSPANVLNAAARALGLVQMDPAARMELLRKLKDGAGAPEAEKK